MRISIRVDSSRLIGSGHVMRCLALAELLNHEGNQISFICRDLPGHCGDLIQNKHYECHLLSFHEANKRSYSEHEATDDYSIWLGVSQEQDALETLEYLSKDPVDLLIVDIYGLDHTWQTQVKNYVRKLMVIDDLANRKHACDVLLDHNYYDNFSIRYDHLAPKSCIKFLGPQYALLHPELHKVREYRALASQRKGEDSINNILVFLGGMDIKNHTKIVLQQLLKSKYANCNLNVVIGKANSFKDKLIDEYRHQKNVKFHVQPSYYFQLLADADFSINAGGVSALERLFIGLPFIVICTAENQRHICEDFQKGKLAEYNENMENLYSDLNKVDPKKFKPMFPELKHGEFIKILEQLIEGNEHD